MLAISEAISREFAPRFTRSDAAEPKQVAFSVQELLAISQEISREYSPRPVEHRSSLVLLPIDPRRLHAYWHLAESSLNVGSNTDSRPAADEPLTLRIFKQSPPPAFETMDQTQSASWFDIPVVNGQCQQEVVLPADTAVAGTTYQAAIGFIHEDHDFTAITVSNAADIPNPPLQRDEAGLPDAVAQFSIPSSSASSPIGKATAHQETRGL